MRSCGVARHWITTAALGPLVRPGADIHHKNRLLTNIRVYNVSCLSTASRLLSCAKTCSTTENVPWETLTAFLRAWTVPSLGNEWAPPCNARAEALDIWRTWYHSTFFRDEPLSEPLPLVELFPADAWDGVSFLQIVCYAAKLLTAGEKQTAAEMESLAFLVSVRYLRAAAAAIQVASCRPGGGKESKPESVSSFTAVRVCSEDVWNGELRRAEGERCREMAFSASPETVEKCTVLLETIHVLLTLPLAISRRFRSELFHVLLSVLCFAEPLDNSALALLTICIAQCADAYDLEEYINGSQLADAPRLMRLSEVQLDSAREVLRSLLCSGEGEIPLWIREERTALESCGSTAQVNSNTVLSVLHVLSREAVKRMNDSLNCYEWDNENTKVAHKVWLELHPHHHKSLKAQQVEEGRRSLLSLQDVKRHCTSSRSATRRRTMADFEKDSGLGVRGKSSLTEEEISAETSLPPMTLSDAADIAEAFASLRYRNNDFWEILTKLTCCEIAVATSSCCEMDGEPEGILKTAFMKELQRICFALDFTQQFDSYDVVMDWMVEHGVLAERVTPQSDALREISFAASSSSSAPSHAEGVQMGRSVKR